MKIERYWRLWILAGAVVLADQLSKAWILHSVTPDTYHYPEIVLIEGTLNIVHIYNEGAAWGMFSGYGHILAFLGFVALFGLYYWREAFGLAKTSRQWTFGLLVGGILGNLIDRLVHGKVIDFIDVTIPWWGYRWPAFNVADSAISVGVILYLIHGLFDKEETRLQEDTSN